MSYTFTQDKFTQGRKPSTRLLIIIVKVVMNNLNFEDKHKFERIFQVVGKVE